MRALPSSFAFLAFLAAFVIAPSSSFGRSWDYHVDPDICHLREITYAIDGVRGQGFRFGGLGGGVISNEFKLQDLDDPTLKWQSVPQVGSPPARRRPQSIYDARRDRFLFLGGIDSDSTRHADVWAWDRTSGAWSELAVAAGGPDSVTNDFAMTYDSRRDRLVYVNNAAAGQHPLIWFLDLSGDTLSWTSLEIASAFSLNPYVLARAGIYMPAAAAYDSLGDRLFFQSPFYPEPSALHVVDLSNPSGFELVPGKNWVSFRPRIAIDPVHNRLILDLDYNEAGEFLSGLDYALIMYDLASLDSTEIPLDQLSAARRPYVNQDFAWAANPVTGAIEVPMMDFPERERRATVVPDVAVHWERHDDVERPNASRRVAGAVDPAGRSLYLFGGEEPLYRWQDNANHDTGFRISGDVYRVDLDDPTHHEHLEPSGIGPGPLLDAEAVFDSVGRRVVIYGGWNDQQGGDHAELWALELEPELHWSQIATTNNGPKRRYAGMTIDPVSRRIYLVGGQNPDPAVQPGFLWALDLTAQPATWMLLRSTGPRVLEADAGFDRVHRRILGVGHDGTFTIDVSDSTSPITEFQFAVSFVDLTLFGRDGVSGAFDVMRNVLFVHGGALRAGFYNYEFPALPTGVWNGETFRDSLVVTSEVQPPGMDGTMAYDPTLDRLLLINGYQIKNYCRLCNPSEQDTPLFGAWTLQLDDAVPTRLDLAGTTLESGAVRVRFAGTGAEGPVHVEREIDGSSEWSELGIARELSPEVYEWLDDQVQPGATYRYRARFDSEGATRFTAASDPVHIPGSVEFALRSPRGAVGRGWPVLLAGQVAPGSQARVELVDVRGRVVARRSVSGAFEIALEPRGSSAGIYFARLVQGESSAVLRLVRL